MAHALPTHNFRELVSRKIKIHKMGTVSYLWGLIKYPKYEVEETLIHSHICEICMQKEFIPVHGYHNVDRMS